MPTHEHEFVIDLFRDRPELAATLLTDCEGMKIPPYTDVTLDSCDLGDTKPAEFRADAVVTLRDNEPRMAIIVEVQRKPDKEKHLDWPVYLTTLHARLRCRTVLMAVCPNDRTAEWADAPIDVGHPHWYFRPVVVGPKDIPVVTKVADAEETPELAVLSTLAHGASNYKVMDALSVGLSKLDPQQAWDYTQYTLELLPKAAKRYLEAIVATKQFRYQSEFTDRYKAEGKAEAIVGVLTSRGLSVPEGAKQRILDCTDADQLDQWVKRAATVERAEDLFG